jgi:putative heme-binding domain-containing protein
LKVFLQLLDDPAFRLPAIPVLARFDTPEIPAALLERFAGFPQEARTAALATLTGRAPFALALMDAVSAGRIGRDQLTAFHVRQLTQLKSPEVDKRVEAAWGKFGRTSAEKEAQIGKLEAIFNEAPLWAYDGRAGQQHFMKLCSSCHQIQGEGKRLGPELTGAGRNGIRYYLENIIDPNAVIGADFQMTTVSTKSGDVTSGIVAGETTGTVTLRTATGDVTISKGEVTERVKSDASLMPEALIDSLNDREQLELLKFLTSH